MLIFATLLSLLGVALLVGIVYGHRQLARGLSRSAVPASRPASYPSVTVIRPMRGLDVGARENILALLDTVYPGPLEILFVFDSESDPGFPLVRELIQQLVDALLADPKAGASFAPILAAADVPTAGDIGYGLLVNAWYGPSVELAAGLDNQLPFIMGQLMVFRREALNAIGGLGCAEGQFVDDMYIGQCVARAGWRNVITAHRLRVVTGGMTMLQFLQIFRRWVLFSAGGLPTQFTRPNWLRGILAWTAWIALILSVAIGSPAATLLCMAAICTVASSQVSLQRSFGGPRVPARYLWVPAILPLIAGAVALSTRFYRRVDWRGRNYNLDRSARLDQPTSSLLENSAKPQ